jgi:cell division protein FtsB
MTVPGDPGRSRRRPRFTSRAAVLAIVFCAIALSLAYPVREYISQRRQIAELTAQRGQINAELRHLYARRRELADPAYIEQQARTRMHMCLPQQTCYVVIGRQHARPAAAAHLAGTPWYRRVLTSVQHADTAPRGAAHHGRPAQ